MRKNRFGARTRTRGRLGPGFWVENDRVMTRVVRRPRPYAGYPGNDGGDRTRVRDCVWRAGSGFLSTRNVGYRGGGRWPEVVRKIEAGFRFAILL